MPLPTRKELREAVGGGGGEGGSPTRLALCPVTQGVDADSTMVEVFAHGSCFRLAQEVGGKFLRELVWALSCPSRVSSRRCDILAECRSKKIIADAEDRPIFHQPKGDAERRRVYLRHRRELKKGPAKCVNLSK